MPQMAPLSWLLLFVVFSFTLILFNMLNYFIYQVSAPAAPDASSAISTSPFNWPW
uniref:ATP synthase complex subunit 8 n=1 Tax=Potamanthus sp. MT-2014 TaxID=1560020 RepID=A0A0A0RWA6_9INSE|nr:ATP synthase F0 subunit 8 [Potamanthus sp. MT-2014]